MGFSFIDFELFCIFRTGTRLAFLRLDMFENYFLTARSEFARIGGAKVVFLVFRLETGILLVTDISDRGFVVSSIWVEGQTELFLLYCF